MTSAAATVYYISCCLVTLFLAICTYLPQLPHIHRLGTGTPCTPFTHCEFIITFIMCYYFSIISLFSLSLHCWEGLVTYMHMTDLNAFGGPRGAVLEA